METSLPSVNPDLFKLRLAEFRANAEADTNQPFASFEAHPYAGKEIYKFEIYRIAREILAFETWTPDDIASGRILAAMIRAIELPDNNLVRWDSRSGEKSRQHQILYKISDEPDAAEEVERCLYNLYCGSSDAETFGRLVEALGKKYSLISYFFFVKNCDEYLPIAPAIFDTGFELLGIDFKTSHQCSWENYTCYIALIDELRHMLASALSIQVRLLDAHSFVWILANYLDKNGLLTDGNDYLRLNTTGRKAFLKEMISSLNQYLPDEVRDEAIYEGAKRSIVVNAYERDSKARRRCLEHWGYICAVCDFNFEDVYGELGKNFIHVHHLKPLANIGKKYKVDPVKDLKPVCPNCHAMLHRGSEVLTIKKLKTKMAKTANAS